MPTLLHKRGATAALGRTTFQVGEIAINTTLNTIIVGTGNRNSVALAKADASNITPNFSSATTPLTLPGGSVSGGGQLRYHNGEIQSSNSSGVFSALASGTASVTSITLTRYANATLLPSATVARLAWRNDVNRPVISNQSGAYSFLLRDGDTFRADTCRLADTATEAIGVRGNRVANAGSADVALSSAGNASFKVPVGITSQRNNTVGGVRLNNTPSISASNTPAIDKFEGRLNSGWDFFVMESNLSNLIDGVSKTGRTNGHVYTIVNGSPAWAAPDTSSSSITASSLTGNFGAIVARSVTTLAGGDITSRNHVYAGHDIETSNGNINARRVSSTATASAGNGNFDGTVTAARFTINGEYSLPTREAGAAGYVLTAINPTTTEFRAPALPTRAGGNSGFVIPVGGRAARGTAEPGKFRLSSENSRPEMVLSGTTWTQLLTALDTIPNATNAVTAIRARNNSGFQVGSGSTSSRQNPGVAGLVRHDSTTDLFVGHRNNGWDSFVFSSDRRLLPRPTLANAGRAPVINAAGNGFDYVTNSTNAATAVRAFGNNGFNVGSRVAPPASAEPGTIVHAATANVFVGRVINRWETFVFSSDTRLLPRPTLANAGRIPVINDNGTGFNYIESLDGSHLFTSSTTMNGSTTITTQTAADNTNFDIKGNIDAQGISIYDDRAIASRSYTGFTAGAIQGTYPTSYTFRANRVDFFTGDNDEIDWEDIDTFYMSNRTGRFGATIIPLQDFIPSLGYTVVRFNFGTNRFVEYNLRGIAPDRGRANGNGYIFSGLVFRRISSQTLVMNADNSITSIVFMNPNGTARVEAYDLPQTVPSADDIMVANADGTMRFEHKDVMPMRSTLPNNAEITHFPIGYQFFYTPTNTVYILVDNRSLTNRSWRLLSTSATLVNSQWNPG